MHQTWPSEIPSGRRIEIALQNPASTLQVFLTIPTLDILTVDFTSRCTSGSPLELRVKTIANRRN